MDFLPLLMSPPNYTEASRNEMASTDLTELRVGPKQKNPKYNHINLLQHQWKLNSASQEIEVFTATQILEGISYNYMFY